MTLLRRWIALAGLLAVAASPAALASIGTTATVTATSNFDSADWKQVVAQCPAGTIAFSGGATLVFSGSVFDDRIIVHQSLPVGNPPNGWLALAQERVAIGESWAVTSVVRCATVSGYELVEATSPFDSSSPKTLQVSCPLGKVPIGGGGGVFFFTEHLALYALVPTATGWLARAAESSPIASSWVLNVKLSCAPAGDITRFELSTSNEVEISEHLSLHCPTGRDAIAGGVVVPAGYGILTISPGGPSGWSAGGLRIGAPPPSWDLSAVVLCSPSPLFVDGFESGDTSRWSSAVP